MKDIINSIGKFIVSIIVTMYQGFIATFLWTWFIFPIFGIATPSFIALAGVFIFVRMFAHLTMADFSIIFEKVKNKESEAFNNLTVWASLGFNFILATGCFFAGWLFHFFV